MWSVPLDGIQCAEIVEGHLRASLLITESGEIRRFAFRALQAESLRAALTAAEVPEAREPTTCPFSEGNLVITPHGDTATVAAVVPPGRNGVYAVIVTRPNRSTQS
jgi:hypothetical protein